jgi:spermidine/putrescine transport system ATP-binding protein
MQVELKALQHRVGITFLVVTHDQEEALVMSDRIAVMQSGRLQQVGPPGEIYDRPANRFVAAFIGNSNLLAGTVTAHQGDGVVIDTVSGLRMHAASGQFAKGERVEVMVRPEQLSLDPAAGEGPTLDGVVETVVFVGADRHVRIRTGTGDPLTALQRHVAGARDPGLAPGAAVRVSYRPEGIHLMPGESA